MKSFLSRAFVNPLTALALLCVMCLAPMLVHAAEPPIAVVQKASVSASAASGITSAYTTTVTVTVPGASMGDACVASHSQDLSNFVLDCKITAANTAKVNITQATTNGAALASGTMRVFLLRKGTQ